VARRATVHRLAGKSGIDQGGDTGITSVERGMHAMFDYASLAERPGVTSVPYGGR
jgi:hypothetical protein